MHIITMTLGALGTNCYIVASDKKDAAIIDPADDFEAIRSRLEKESLTPQLLLLTHGHYDHLLAAQKLSEAYGLPVCVHEGDLSKMTNPMENLHGYFNAQEDFEPIRNVQTFSDGDELAFDEIALRVLYTPGHTGGSVCFLCGNDFFSGDTLFEGSIGRTDMPDGDYMTMMGSLQKITDLLGDYRIYPGHGKMTTLNRERRENLFLTGIGGI